MYSENECNQFQQQSKLTKKNLILKKLSDCIGSSQESSTITFKNFLSLSNSEIRLTEALEYGHENTKGKNEFSLYNIDWLMEGLIDECYDIRKFEDDDWCIFTNFIPENMTDDFDNRITQLVINDMQEFQFQYEDKGQEKEVNLMSFLMCSTKKDRQCFYDLVALIKKLLAKKRCKIIQFQ